KVHRLSGFHPDARDGCRSGEYSLFACRQANWAIRTLVLQQVAQVLPRQHPEQPAASRRVQSKLVVDDSRRTVRGDQPVRFLRKVLVCDVVSMQLPYQPCRSPEVADVARLRLVLRKSLEPG